MKCKYCLAKIDSSEPFCPTCGRKNPLAAPGAAARAPFRLDEEPEIKPSSIPTAPPRTSFRPPVTSSSSPRSGAGKQSSAQGCCLVFVIVFILFILFNIFAVVLSRM